MPFSLFSLLHYSQNLLCLSHPYLQIANVNTLQWMYPRYSNNCISEMYTIVTLEVSMGECWWNRKSISKIVEFQFFLRFFYIVRLLYTGMHKNTNVAPAPRWWKDERGQQKVLFTDSLHTITFIFPFLQQNIINS